jgi:phosphatidylserine/phosphatidylglycerophosphate/cardiolipin synthase-like enzyme
VEKGISWSPIEHYILFAICELKRSNVEILCQKTNLPQAVVVETVARFSKFQWVSLQFKGEITWVIITNLGVVEVNKEHLTVIKDRIVKRIVFAIDRYSGQMFKLKTRRVLTGTEVKMRLKGADDPLLPNCYDFVSSIENGPPDYIFQELEKRSDWFGQDETLINWTNPSYVKDDRYISIRLVNGVVEEPTIKIEDLKSRIQDYTDNLNEYRVPAVSTTSKHFLDRPTNWKTHSFSDHDYELVVGGEEHLRALEQALSRAKTRVIIYSTFIRETNQDMEKLDLGGLHQLLLKCMIAAERGIEVDILFDFDCSNLKQISAFNKFQEMVSENRLTHQIRIHKHVVQSHAKFICYDDISYGPTVIISSCNWCSTGFQPFDVSVLLRSELIVVDTLHLLLNLLPTFDGIAELKSKLRTWIGAAFADTQKDLPNSVKAKILVSGQFVDMIHTAINQASSQIVVVSNKLGLAAENQVIEPLIAAAERSNIKIVLYYQNVKENPFFDKNHVSRLRERLGKRIMLKRMKRSTHAKFICWDSDNVIISSLNFLSKADNINEPYGEVGVHLTESGISNKLLQRLENHLKSK